MSPTQPNPTQPNPGVVGFFRREQCDVCTRMDLGHRGLTPDFIFYIFLAEA